MRVHILFCDTRVTHNGSGTLLAESFARLGRHAHQGIGFQPPTLSNLCAGRQWRSNFFELKFSALAHWIRSSEPNADDLLLVLDTDVVANGVLNSAALIHRFHEARGTRRIVYQAEPSCWAEFGHSKAIFRRDGCSRAVLRSWGEIPKTRDLSPSCGRFLCGGAFAGFAADVSHLVQRMADLRALNREIAARNKAPKCYFEPGEKKLSDQCLATHVLLAHRDWLGLDYHEALFAYAATVAAPHEAGAIKVSPCGNSSCSMAPTFQWAASTRTRLSRLGQALERPLQHQQRCHLRAGGPAFIHFNGPPKELLLSQARKLWAA